MRWATGYGTSGMHGCVSFWDGASKVPVVFFPQVVWEAVVADGALTTRELMEEAPRNPVPRGHRAAFDCARAREDFDELNYWHWTYNTPCSYRAYDWMFDPWDCYD